MNTTTTTTNVVAIPYGEETYLIGVDAGDRDMCDTPDESMWITDVLVWDDRTGKLHRHERGYTTWEDVLISSVLPADKADFMISEYVREKLDDAEYAVWEAENALSEARRDRDRWSRAAIGILW